MNTINDYYLQAELSLTSYGTFATGAIPVNKLTSIDVGMSTTQAASFVSIYTVLAQSTPTTNGFSATLFLNNQTGEKTLAIRGTDTFVDFATDFVDVLILGGVFAQEQYASLNGFYQQLIVQGALTSSETFSVSGHSLGGFLAQAFSVDHPSNATQTYTYNAPGIGGGVAEVLSWLGATNTNIAASNILNVQASGPTVIAGLGTLLGNIQTIFTEGSPHSIVPLTDSLAVYNLFAQLDPTLNTGVTGINAITDILKASSNVANRSLENTLDAMRTLFNALNAGTPTATDNRDQLYKNLADLQTAINCYSSPFTLRDLSAFSAAQIASIAEGNIAYRYALLNLTPFALVGNDAVYAPHNTAGELTLSAQYLTDRAKMLGVLIERNTTDSTNASGDILYSDAASNLTLRSGSHATNDMYQQIRFGDSRSNTLTGGIQDDHLYGMGGNDTLKGGLGTDTYDFKTGDGQDTITDSDGLGKILENGTQLAGTTTKLTSSAGVMQWADGGTTYQFTPANIASSKTGRMVITSPATSTSPGQADTITINNFDLGKATGADGYLGIKLGKQLAIKAGVDQTSPFTSGTPSDQTAAVPTGNVKTFTLYALAASDTDQTVTLTQTGGTCQLCTGADMVAFDANGEATVIIPAGQDHVTFTLVDTSTTGLADTATLTATMADANGGTVTSNWLAVTFDSPIPIGSDGNSVINMDQANWLLTEIHRNPSNVDPNWTWVTSNGNDTINAGTGGFNYIAVGNGNNLINGNGGTGGIAAGNGNNQIYANTQMDLASALAYAGTATATQPDSSQYFYAKTPVYPLTYGSDYTYTGIHGVMYGGQVIGVGNGDNTIVGGTGNGDAIIVGTGNNTIVCGPGQSTVICGFEATAQYFDPRFSITIADAMAASGVTDPSGYYFYDYAVTYRDGAYIGPWGPYSGVPVGGGNNTIFGGKGDTKYYLSNGDNWLDAGGGNDLIVAGIGNNTIFAGTGNVNISGGGGDNYINLESGNGSVILNGGNNTIVGGAGNSTITVNGSGNNYIYGGSGNAVIHGSEGNDYLDGGAGDDVIHGGGGNDTLLGGAGNNTLYGGAGNDTYIFEAGSKNTVYDSGNNTYIFGAGFDPDTLKLREGSLLMDFGPSTGSGQVGGEVHLMNFDHQNASGSLAGASFEFADGTVLTADQLLAKGFDITATAGDDILTGTSATDRIAGLAGNDTLSGMAGDDTLTGDTGNDTLIGGTGGDAYIFNRGDGQDVISDNGDAASTDTLQFAPDILQGDVTLERQNGDLLVRVNGSTDQIIVAGQYTGTTDGIERIVFGDGATLNAQDLLAVTTAPITGTDQNDVLNGSGFADNILGMGGDDVLNGGGGDDILQGGDGNDTLINGATLVGGAGNDFMDGGAGATRYLIDPAQTGIDRIGDSGDSGAGYKPWYYNSLGIQNWEERENFGGYYTSSTIGSDTGYFTAAQLADPNNWLAGWFAANPGDLIYIDPLPPIQRPAANDYAALQPLYDAGIIPLDTVEFGAGITLADLGLSWGQDGGNATLDMSWNNGASQVRLVVPNAGDPLGFGVEQVKFAPSTGSGQAGMVVSMADLIALAPSPDLNLTGTGNADVLNGNFGNDIIDGMGGNDVIDGQGGNDTLYGGGGVDYLNGGEGDDVIRASDHANTGLSVISSEENGSIFTATVAGTATSYRLYGAITATNSFGGYDHDFYKFSNLSAGTVFSAATFSSFDTVIGLYDAAGNRLTMNDDAGGAGGSFNDVDSAIKYTLTAGGNYYLGIASYDSGLPYNTFFTDTVGGDIWALGHYTATVSFTGGYADSPVSILEGNLGNDTIYGGVGDDVYSYWIGDGQDTVIDHDATAGSRDVLRLEDALSADVSLAASGYDLVVNVGAGGDTVTIKNWLLPDGSYRVERIEFADGAAWDAAAIAGMVPAPVNHAPVAAAIAVPNAIQGQAFSLNAAAAFSDPDANGALAFTASLADGSALPTWIAFDVATGTFCGTPGNEDVGSLNIAVTATDMGGLTATTTFAMGVVNANDAPTVISSLSDQSIVAGEAFSYTLPGGNTGSNGFLNDATDTGTPDQVWMTYDKYLYGGGGNDTYTFKRGDGNVYIGEWNNPSASPMDVVRMGQNIAPSDITVEMDGWDLKLSVNDTGDSVTLGWWTEGQSVEQVAFSGGTVWGVSDLMAMIPASSTAGNDLITGTNSNDVILSLGGDDRVYGGDGIDTVLGGAGHDHLYGGAGDDTISGGSGDDYIEGDSGSNILIGGDGADELGAEQVDGSYLDTAHDMLNGGAGDDYLDSSIGNDLLIGGVGSDWVGGNDGNDVMLFNRGDGNDYCSSWSAKGVLMAQRSDTVSLGGGISYADLSFGLNFDGTELDGLVLNLGNGESITFGGWFSTWWDDKAISKLQIVVEAMPGYDQNSTNPLLNQRIQQFDFLGLASQFEAARAADPTITTWQLAPHLAGFSLGGSDTAAIGGDMAYLYGKNGNLDGLAEAELRAQLNDASFGTANQTLTKTPDASAAFADVDFIHGDSLTYSATLADGSPLPAWLTFDAATRTFNGVPVNGNVGALNVSVIATDTGGLFATTNFVLTVTGVGQVNVAPLAADDTANVGEDVAQTTIAVADLLANDTDPDVGDTLSLAGFDAVTAQGNAVSQDAAGDLVIDIGNNYQSLGAGQTANDSFNYTVSDAAGSTSTATVAVTIAGANDAPVTATAIAGQQTNEDAPFSFTVPANTFTDIDNGDTLSYGATLADGTALPSWLTFDAATQTFSGTPGNSDVGSYSVTVTATDTGGLAASSVFAVDVANVNDAPTVSMALADHAALQDAAFSFSVPAGTFDDVDFIHGDTLSYGATLADGAALPGWLTFDAATQTFSGIPLNQDVGNLNVLVTATDTGGLSATSNFALNVINANDAPTANADAGVATEGGGAVLLDAATLLANDTDPDFVHGDALNIVGVSQAASGAAVSLLNGNVQYDVGALFQSLGQGQTASDTFSYTVSDMAGTTSTATVTMTVTGVNDGPVTVNDAAVVQEDAALVATGNVLSNDTDVDQGTVLSVANAGTLQGNYGSLILNGDGNYSYALDNTSAAVQGLLAGQTVTETFAYQATDGIATTPATLTVTITGSNDAPVTVTDVAVAQEGLTIIATGNVLANDTDVDQGAMLSVVDAGLFAGSYGQLTLATDGSYSYALNNALLGVQSLAAGQVVTETFAYAATDGLIATPSTLTVTITGTNDAPVTVADAAAVQEDISITATGNVLINDSDVDQGAALSVLNAGVFAGNYGQLTLATDGNYTYALDNASPGVQSLAAGQVVTETFAYEATDGTVATPSALTVSITGTNDAPVAAADAAYVREDLNITATGNVLGNDSDVDQGTVLSVADAGVRAGSYGSLNLAADGSYSYAVDNASHTVQSMGRTAQVAEHFGYTATDGMVGASAVLDVFLNGANDAPILVAPLADQNFTFHKHFSWQMPEGSFTDIDQGDTLGYAATLADGSALPDWLSFDAATRTFSGETPKEVGFVDVQVVATDSVAATGSTAGSLSASDVFRISVSHGNEGVGNGEDAPPPGHDHNTNDGAGTSPGHPGSRGGNDHPSASASHPQEQDRHERSSDAKTHKDDTRQQDSEDTEDSGSHRTDELIRTWFEEESASEQYSSFGALDRHGAWGGQIDRQVNRNVARGLSGDVSQEWERMNARLKKHLEQSGGDEGLFAESGTGSRSFGLFGSGGSQGIAQLGMGSGQQLKSLAGLKEGLERLGC